jgi:hypothetical protein
MVRHALRDALIPSITVPAQDFGFMIIVAVETVFAYPDLAECGRTAAGADGAAAGRCDLSAGIDAALAATLDQHA